MQIYLDTSHLLFHENIPLYVSLCACHIMMNSQVLILACAIQTQIYLVHFFPQLGNHLAGVHTNMLGSGAYNAEVCSCAWFSLIRYSHSAYV